MNKRQAKKYFRKSVHVFPYGSRTAAGIWKKKRARKDHTEMLRYGEWLYNGDVAAELNKNKK